MSIINRRNAVIGWMFWAGVKSVGKRKARGAVPTIEDGKPNPSLIAVALAAAAGALAFIRARRTATD